MAFAAVGVLGATLGSFLNVVAYRLPRHESLVTPASHCPSCGVPVRPYDNVPVLSWLLLRGRCRHCSQRISPRYPLVELGTALLCVGAVVAHPSLSGAVLGVTLVLLLVPAALIDADHKIIPNMITGPGAVAAVVLGTALDPSGEPARLIAGLAAGGFLLVAALAYPRGMGMGDVKLAGMMGLFLGAAVAPAMFVAMISALVAGAAVMARKGVVAGRRTKVPFGPFLALGAIVGLYAGWPLIHLYLNHLT